MARGEALEFTVPGPGGDRTVRVSNPDKVYFPERGITKRQIVEYYLAVSEPLLGVLAQRPVTLKRFVDGVTGEAFYAKRVPRGAPAWVWQATGSGHFCEPRRCCTWAAAVLKPGSLCAVTPS